MDGMDMGAGEYDHYWETQMFFDAEELDSWGLEDAFSGSYDSSSPEGAASSAMAKKTIAQERERRKRFNEKLYTLRSLVPSITKMDKASIVKDAIDYILALQEEEKKLRAEVSELEQGNGMKKPEMEHYVASIQKGKKKSRTSASSESPTLFSTPINVTELKVRELGDGTSIVSITCTRQKDTMGRLCEALQSLHVNILAANITSFSGNLIHTLFIEAHEMDGTQLKQSVEAALAGYN